METSLKTGFAQIFSCCPKNLSCPNFGGAAAPLAPPARTPMTRITSHGCSKRIVRILCEWLEMSEDFKQLLKGLNLQLVAVL